MAGLEPALGSVCWWGLSPALDLSRHLPPPPVPAVSLLLGGAEGRHLLSTAAWGGGETLHVRAEMLLELLGSVRLRTGTAAIVAESAARLRRWVCGGGRGGPRGPPDLSLMKVGRTGTGDAGRELGMLGDLVLGELGMLRELLLGGSGGAGGSPFAPQCRDRDAVGAVLRRWERPEPPSELWGWETRLRQRLGPRPPPSPPRSSGSGERVASPSSRGGGAPVPNPTLHSPRHPHHDGQPGPEFGYWGDIVTGPFLAFGFPPPGEKSPQKTATELSLATVTALLQELLSGDPPKDPPGDQNPPRDPPLEQDPPSDDPSPLGPLAPLRIRIRYLPLSSAHCPPHPSRLGGPCGLLVLGWRSLPALTPALGELAAPGATLLVELPTFVPTLRPPQLDAFRARVEAQARASGFEPWGGPGEPPAHARFRRPPQP
ncbi:dynein axonemal assembly factor 3 [Cuculus canorus]|uniref:dynein axonemal assembly factor 3 n=1 Tax=Cuculus canorus TaxID=55661 RepID=UPI0023AB1DA5|nr:dynein axonemal assembly factor 3 [Cuculus canorus]